MEAQENTSFFDQSVLIKKEQRYAVGGGKRMREERIPQYSHCVDAGGGRKSSGVGMKLKTAGAISSSTLLQCFKLLVHFMSHCICEVLNIDGINGSPILCRILRAMLKSLSVLNTVYKMMLKSGFMQ
jgi:hypothetical protein